MIDHRGEKDGTPRRPGPATDEIDAQANALVERMRRPVDVRTRSESDDRPTDGFQDRSPPMPERLGRFRVTGRLGAGAMGIVFSAHDPLLDRDVAVKLMQPHRVSPMALARASREAQAMARLSHPNIVQVYGIGHHGDALYVAMEFIDGDTLAFWQESDAYDWTVILAAYRQAGLGLAALHEHGLVHRDFKPANAMRGSDGRVRVLDLGLVRETHDAVPPEVPAEVSEAASMSSEETETNAVLGTPAYMSPEQFLGEAVSPASDQFSFCIALYEALYGQRPFKGRTSIQLVEAIVDQRIEPAPSGSAVPARVFRALTKGLAHNPAARHGSMRELLDALEGGRRGRGWWLAGVGVAAFAVVGAFASTPGELVSAPCDGALAAKSAWDASARSGVLAQLGETSAALRELDAYAASLRDDAERACAEVEVQPGVGACQVRLAARLEEVAALLSTDIGPEVTPDALTSQLPSIGTCRLDQPPQRELDPAALTRVARLSQRAKGLAQTPERARALVLAQKAVEEAHQLGHAPAQIEALRARGEVFVRDSNYGRAADDFQAAYELSLSTRDDDRAAHAANAMVWVLLQMRDLDEAERWARVTRAAAERTNTDDPTLRAYALHRLGLVAMYRGDSQDALELMGNSLELWRAADEPREIGTVMADLQKVAADLGDLDASVAYAKDAVKIFRDNFGQNDRQLGTAYHNLGNALQNKGEDEAALEAYQRGYAARRASYGPKHLKTGVSAYAVATALVDTKEYEEAFRMLERARAALPEVHPARAASDMLEANVAQERGQTERALSLTNRALVSMETMYGADHPNIGLTRVNKATMLRTVGDFEGAVAEATMGLEVLVARLGAEHPMVARGLRSRGLALIELTRWSEALADLEQALSIQENVLGEDAEPVTELRKLLADTKRRSKQP